MKVLTQVFKAGVSAVELIPFLNNHAEPTSHPDSLKNILIFGYGGLGDMVFLLPAIQSVRQWLPSAKITVVTGPYSAARDLIGKGGAVDEVKIVDWVAASHSERARLNQELIAMKFDACLSSYTNPVRFFLPLLAKIPIRVGEIRKLTPPPALMTPWLELNIWQEELYRRKAFNRPVVLDIDTVQEHDIFKHLKMASALGVPSELLSQKPVIHISSPSGSAAAALFQSTGLKLEDMIIGVSVGVSAGMEWKIWDMEKMAHLLERICDHTASKVIFFGSASERPLLEKFKATFHKPVVDMVGKTGVQEMAALIKSCRLFISNDSGPSKLAMALGIPTATIWGASDRFGAGPWEPDRHVSIVSKTTGDPFFRVGLAKPGISSFAWNLSVDEAYENLRPLLEKVR